MGMFDWRAIGAAAATSCAKSGPMISSAPSWIALCAAACAPAGVPLVSFGTSETDGLSKSNSASSAACFSALATEGVLPEPVSGRSRATFTAPVEPVTPGLIGPGPLPPPQAASSIETAKPASRAFAARSVRPIRGGSRMTPSLQGERSARLSRGLGPRAADASLPSSIGPAKIAAVRPLDKISTATMAHS